jgi:hypothetical protein
MTFLTTVPTEFINALYLIYIGLPLESPCRLPQEPRQALCGIYHPDIYPAFESYKFYS